MNPGLSVAGLDQLYQRMYRFRPQRRYSTAQAAAQTYNQLWADPKEFPKAMSPMERYYIMAKLHAVCQLGGVFVWTHPCPE